MGLLPGEGDAELKMLKARRGRIPSLAMSEMVFLPLSPVQLTPAGSSGSPGALEGRAALGEPSAQLSGVL